MIDDFQVPIMKAERFNATETGVFVLWNGNPIFSPSNDLLKP